jgi:hypothetical protein
MEVGRTLVLSPSTNMNDQQYDNKNEVVELSRGRCSLDRAATCLMNWLLLTPTQKCVTATIYEEEQIESRVGIRQLQYQKDGATR